MSRKRTKSKTNTAGQTVFFQSVVRVWPGSLPLLYLCWGFNSMVTGLITVWHDEKEIMIKKIEIIMTTLWTCEYLPHCSMGMWCATVHQNQPPYLHPSNLFRRYHRFTHIHVICYDPTSWSWSSWTQTQALGQSTSSTPLVELQRQWYITQGLEWSKELFKGQESAYSGSEDLWQRVLTMSPLRDSEGKGQWYISILLRYQDGSSKRDLTRYSGIFE